MRRVGAKQQVSASKPRFRGLDTTPPDQAHLAAPETCCAKVVGFRESLATRKRRRVGVELRRPSRERWNNPSALKRVGLNSGPNGLLGSHYFWGPHPPSSGPGWSVDALARAFRLILRHPSRRDFRMVDDDAEFEEEEEEPSEPDDIEDLDEDDEFGSDLDVDDVDVDDVDVDDVDVVGVDEVLVGED